MVYPKKDVWQREYQKEFIDDLQKIDPNVTGTPVQLYHYTDLLKRSYEEAARYSLIAIALLVLLHFRSPLSLALALIPVAVGFIWLGGLMGAFDVPLNPANIMTLPLVIGIGVTNGIHILNRFAEEQTPSILARSTGKAVLVSGLTAIAEGSLPAAIGGWTVCARAAPYAATTTAAARNRRMKMAECMGRRHLRHAPSNFLSAASDSL